MTDERSNLTTIDALIQRKQLFAVYRVPEEKYPRLLIEDAGTVCLTFDLEELNEQRGFVIVPFRIGESCPIVLIQSDRTGQPLPMEIVVEGEQDLQSYPEESFYIFCTGKYATRFHTFIEALRDATFDKLVLSRSLTIGRNLEFSPSAVSRAACQRYIHSYIHLCYTSRTGVWPGSIPEITLPGEKDEWNIVALAGTQPLQNGKLSQVWDDKNRQEQDYVASYIRRQLLSLGIRSTESGSYPTYAGALSHLKIDPHLSLKDDRNLGDPLRALHPTPAIYGLLKEEAYRFILENKGYGRKYYSGFIGWFDPEGRTNLHVNLRYMHIEDEQLTLCTGGGLLASSELNDEWQETEKKLQTMRRTLVSAPIMMNH